MGRSQRVEESQGFQTEISKKEDLKEELKQGYSKMANLNLKLAREGLLAEREAYQKV